MHPDHDPDAVERDDAALVAAVAEGDRAALRILFDRHAPWLVLRLRRRSADHALVDEVVADTFLAVWRRANSYRGDGEVAGWLWRIALNRLIDRLRRRTPRPVDVVPEPAERIRSAEDQALVDLRHGDLAPALQNLSPDLRGALQATVIDGLTYREASRLLGIPVGTVKTRAMRARAQLREELS